MVLMKILSGKVAVMCVSHTQESDIQSIFQNHLVVENWGPNMAVLRRVADAFQKQGLGKYLVEQGLKIAQAEQVEKVSMKFFEDNAAMTKLAAAFGFETAAKDGVMTATKAF